MNPDTLFGRDLDAAVAFALGWRWVLPYRRGDPWRLAEPSLVCDLRPGIAADAVPEGEPRAAHGVPLYSSKIADAWEVVEHLRAAGWWFALSSDSEGLFDACFWREVPGTCARENYWATAEAPAGMPAAVCRAALKALSSPPSEQGG